MVKFTFCPTRDFNELRMPKMNSLQLLRHELPTALGNSIERRDSRRLRKSRLLSPSYFDLLVKIIVVVLSRVPASRDLNFSVSDVVVLLGRLLCYQRSLYLETALSRAPQPQLSRSDLVLWHAPEAPKRTANVG